MTEETLNKLLRMIIEQQQEIDGLLKKTTLLVCAIQEIADDINRPFLNKIPVFGSYRLTRLYFEYEHAMGEYKKLEQKCDTLVSVNHGWLLDIMEHWLEVRPQDKKYYAALKQQAKDQDVFSKEEWRQIEAEEQEEMTVHR